MPLTPLKLDALQLTPNEASLAFAALPHESRQSVSGVMVTWAWPLLEVWVPVDRPGQRYVDLDLS